MSQQAESLSNKQARKLVLLSQRLPSPKQPGKAKEATLSTIKHLGYIQIDAISVIQRAHHHTLWNRDSRYKESHLHQLLEDREVFEYWSHAAAYLPMADYRFSLIRKQALQSGSLKHWYEPDNANMRIVLKRIESEGPLMARDFEHVGKKVGEWKSKPAKQALEYLFMQGDLMVPRRNEFHKVYDLTERVLPTDVDASLPEPDEYARYLIKRFLRANGLGQPAEMAYLLKGTKPLVVEALGDLVSSGELQEVRVENQKYFAMVDALELMSKPLARNKLKILSPFDNLVIQRKRMLELFDFDYQIECYVPEAKRKFGYFCLPILWDGRLVARMDCKVDRKTTTLFINHLHLENQKLDLDAFSIALEKEVRSFLRFNNCRQLQLKKVTPAKIKQQLKKALIETAV